MQTTEPASTVEYTEIFIKTFEIAYANSDLDKVAVTKIQLDKNQCKKLMSLLTGFEDFLYGTFGKWDNNTIGLELKPKYKLFNAIYDLVPKINKDNLC